MTAVPWGGLRRGALGGGPGGEAAGEDRALRLEPLLGGDVAEAEGGPGPGASAE